MTRTHTTGLVALLLTMACSRAAAAEQPTADNANQLIKHYQSLNYLVVTPNGPEDGGDFGPKTAGTRTSGLQEALDRAHEEVRDVYIVGGGLNQPAKKGIVYHLEQTLHLPWMQDWRLDGGEYALSYSGQEGDAVVVDSQMNCRLKFGLIINEKSDGAVVRIRPSSKGPDGFCCCVASSFEFNALVGAGDVWGKSTDQKSTGLILDSSKGGINGNKISILEINGCRRGVYVTQGSGNNTIEAQWIHLTNLGIQLGDPQGPAVSGNRILAGISGDIRRTTGVRVFGRSNTLIVDVFSADPGRGLVFEGPARDNLVIAGNLRGGITNSAQTPTNRILAPLVQGWDAQTPPVTASGTDVTNRNPFPVEVRILTSGKVLQWVETDSEGKAHTFEGPLDAGQSFILNPGDRVGFTYEEPPEWHWKGLR